VTFTHAHFSGRWDASARDWRRATRRATALASVVTFTETTSRNPRPVGAWAAYHGEERPGANEGSVLWDGDVWEQHGPGFAVPVSRTIFALGNGKPRPRVHLIGVPLRHKPTGRVVVVAVFHMPSAVESARGLVPGVRRSAALVEACAGMVAYRRGLRKEYPRAAFLFAGDLNLNVRRPWVRAFLRAALPGLRTAWKRLPERGTHGSRVIDDARHSRRLQVVGTARRLAKPDGFDHAPLLTRFRFRKGRRWNST
jgi:hypothetical protein